MAMPTNSLYFYGQLLTKFLVICLASLLSVALNLAGVVVSLWIGARFSLALPGFEVGGKTYKEGDPITIDLNDDAKRQVVATRNR